MILAATLLWSVEVVVREAPARTSLAPRTLAAARMGIGHGRCSSCWVAITGQAGRRSTGARRRAVALGAAHRAAAHGLRRHVVRRARARAGDRRDRGARVRRRRHGAALRRRRRRADQRRSARSSSRSAPALDRVWPPSADRRRPRRLLPRDATGAAGPLLFARYAYPPNALGLCGADAPRTLLEYGDAGASRRRPRRAGADLRRRVAVPHPDRRRERHRRSARPARRRGVLGRQRAARPRPARRPGAPRRRPLPRPDRPARASTSSTSIAAGAVPHHCFHVFAVYPWLGLLRTGVVDQPLHVLDQCRTTPARRAVGRRARRVEVLRPAAPLGATAPSASASRSRAPSAGRTTVSRSSTRPSRATASRCTGTSSATCSPPPPRGRSTWPTGARWRR